MSDELAVRSDVAALATRVRELEAQLIRTSLGTGGLRADTNCTNCDTHCTNCAGDRFQEVLLPGEFERLSGRELVKKVQAAKAK
jgi:hypothetical protein